ncbi:lysine transporter LysE [Knoellia sinensis KCTC 19936]|uniref:Lysine transporter LysE n=1 Tax=Knoellia sinensis KCTC 19936 TaxID=1385520 RepID=A0A0A0J628_9MICO|nr:LysE family translocator [Knoellia sinensis]KGN31492.1 lysine transporter LysE [Knoellia sinensis KCTC 19936]
MALSSITAFWAVSILLVLTPGAEWAYAISAGLRHRSVLPAVGGMLSGHLLATALVAAGLAAAISRSPLVLAALTATGAAYLVWLGVSTLTQEAPHPADLASGPVTEESTWSRQLVKGLGVSGLNPKVFLLFLALLPQFVQPQQPASVPVQIAALGILHVATCAVVYIAVAVGAKRVLRARPRAAMVVTRISGVVMVAMGVFLLVEQVLHA